MKKFHKYIARLAVGLTLLSSVGSAAALQLQKFSIDLTESRPGESGSYQFVFTHTQAATIKSVTFQFCKTPSGSCASQPDVTTTAAEEGTLVGLTGALWTLNNTSNASPRLVPSTGNDGQFVSALTKMDLTLTTISNHSIDSCESGGDVSADTCYVRLTTYSDTAGTTAIDSGVASYTVIVPVTVSARVDPTFTFTVGADAASQVHSGITTSVATTYNTIPFSNLTSGTPKYAAHKLNVTTNTENGYIIYMKMINQMTGVYTNNNIDPFAKAGVGWDSPATWQEPDGNTANDNSGWIGANTTDTDVPNWSSTTLLFGPVSGTQVAVMQATRSDNGATAVYVTYAIEANVFQPADTYTGTLVYDALPTY
jgi:hypothetical protein